MRQSAQWGMRAVQSSFPRLKDMMVLEERGERIIFNCLFHLYNWRSRLVGINQIAKNVYLPALDFDANVQFVNV